MAKKQSPFVALYDELVKMIQQAAEDTKENLKVLLVDLKAKVKKVARAAGMDAMAQNCNLLLQQFEYALNTGKLESFFSQLSPVSHHKPALSYATADDGVDALDQWMRRKQR